MSRRVTVHPDYLDRAPRDWQDWSSLAGPAIALSCSSSTQLVAGFGLALYIKRYRYSCRQALRAAFRNTLLRPSRAAHEFKMLETFRKLAGKDIAPSPVAFGEHRSLGFLREAFIATRAVPEATPLSEALPPFPDRAEALSSLLARIHGAGLVHGGLFDRNVLAATGRGFLVVDLDRAQRRTAGRLSPRRLRARDLAFLDGSVRGASMRERLEVIRLYLRKTGESASLRRWLRAIDRWRGEAEERIRRRQRKRG